MAHWGWYWKIKMKHTPKRQCSGFIQLDSFALFRNKDVTKACLKTITYEIPQYNLKITLFETLYFVQYDGGSYAIPIETQICNFGGLRYFFHCPQCDKRMRMLYCNNGMFLCRQCLKLGYLSQQLRPTVRCATMAGNIRRYLENRGGSLYKKPVWMKKKTFAALRSKHNDYFEDKYQKALKKEVIEYYPKVAAREGWL